MKKLAVMRHATASSGRVDYERALTSFGVEQAREAAARLKNQISPDRVLVSGALRTRMTVEAVGTTMGIDPDTIVFDDRIYESSFMNLVCLLKEIDDEVNEAVLIGHNPGVSSLVTALTGVGCPFSPGSFAVIELSIEKWSDLEQGELTAQFSPN